MSAADQMRAMLDQLMGTGRDGEKSKYSVPFDDSRVCKSFLLGCCPCDILSSTRMDLGECSKIHDIALRADFENAQKTHDYYYDIDVTDHLQSFINDCDRKTEMAKRRLKETQEELSDEGTAKVNTIHGYGEQIGTKLARAEALGAEGMVDESLKLMEEVDELKKKKTLAEMDYRNTMPASNYQQQKLRVCEVCSAFLGIHDNDRRLADHFGGKLHVGFITLRQRFAELQETLEARRQQREKERSERRTSREPSVKKADEAGTRRSRSPRRSRSRHRSGSRSEKRRRSPSGERNRHRRSNDDHHRSSDRGHRSSRDKRSRSRSRTKQSTRRSRSRDSKRRSRSRSHSGSRRGGGSRGRDKKSPKTDYRDY